MKIVWNHLALSDLNQAHNYIAITVSNPCTAIDIIKRIETISTLSLYPEIGKLGRVADTRELVVTRIPFIALDRFQSKQVEILAVIHISRNWSDSL